MLHTSKNKTYHQAQVAQNKANIVEIIFLILGIYIVSRLIIGLEYFAITKILNNSTPLVNNLWRWDSGIYQSIVKSGYDVSFDGQSSNWPFFPLWVIILKIASLNGTLPIHVVGELINQLLFISSLGMLYLLLDTYLFTKINILFGIVILSISPANIYFCSGLTESLFLFLSICGFYFLQTNQPRYYLICGALLSATRMTGAFFILPMLYHLYQQHELTAKRLVIYSLICISGLLLFMGYMQIHTGSALSFLEVESKIPSWVRPGLVYDFSIGEQIYNVLTGTSHIYDRVIFPISLIIITFILWRNHFIKEALFNLGCVLPGLISGHMWNAFRFDTAIITFYLGCILIAKNHDLFKYLVLAIFMVMSFICWFYWLNGSYYFA